MPRTIDDLDRFLRRFTCFKALVRIGDASRSLAEKHIPFCNFSFQRRGQEYKRTITQWGLACIAYRLVINSNDWKGKEFQYEDLLKTAFLFGELKEPFETDNDVLGFLGRMSQEQFWWQETMGQELGRTYLLYETIAAENGQSLKFNFGYEFQRAFGLTITDFLTIGHTVLGRALEKSCVFRKEYLLRHEIPALADILTAEKLANWLKIVAADYRELRTVAGNINKVTLPGYERYEFNPLFRFPVVLGGSRFSDDNELQLVVPNILLLAKRLTDGVYWALSDLFVQKGSDEFRIAFGQLFELYVGELLKRYFGQDNVERLEPDEQDHKIADWLVWRDGLVLIIECKASLLPIMVRQTYQPGMFNDWVDRVFVDACKQLDSTEGILKTEGRIIGKETRKFAVLYEKLYLAEVPHLKRAIQEVLRQKFGSVPSFSVMTVKELECLEKPIARHGFEEILKQRDQMHADPILGMGYDFIEPARRLGSEDFSNEWLRRTCDEYFERLLA